MCQLKQLELAVLNILYEMVDSLWEYEEEYARLGVAYLQDQRLRESIEVFYLLSVSSFQPEWRTRGQWYLMLAYLESGEKYSKEFEAILNDGLQSTNMDEKMKARFTELDAAYKRQYKK